MSDSNPLAQLNLLGQSVWYDFIRRDLIQNGTLTNWITQDRLAGMTTNPAIFAAAIGGSALYDADIQAAPPASDANDVLRSLAIADVRAAADLFRPVYEQSGGRDGFVSIEVDPRLSHDAQGTIREAQTLWKLCDRPNVMIKIPGTVPGLDAIEQTLISGINVNVTLLFSVSRYRDVMDRYIRALQIRRRQGLSIGHVASVASFFISRVDTMLDPTLRRLAKEGHTAEIQTMASNLTSKIGIANARLAYAEFEKRFAELDAIDLVGAGAQIQRPLWASTSTKDPTLSDIIYVESLVGKNTVNTMPPVTYDAYRDRGSPQLVLGGNVDADSALLAGLAPLGILFTQVTDTLEDEGCQKFVDAHLHLLEVIRQKRAGQST
ncbi:MAG: transaldolase [Myxococcales bacterium]|nr:transaldolase [Myxococcales bacterium]